MELTYEMFVKEYGVVVFELIRNFTLTHEDYDTDVLSDHFFNRDDISKWREVTIKRETKYLFEKYSKQINDRKKNRV